MRLALKPGEIAIIVGLLVLMAGVGALDWRAALIVGGLALISLGWAAVQRGL